MRSVTEQPMARADSTTSVIFSSMASSRSRLLALGGGVLVSALISTVPLTDLLISRLTERHSDMIMVFISPQPVLTIVLRVFYRCHKDHSQYEIEVGGAQERH